MSVRRPGRRVLAIDAGNSKTDVGARRRRRRACSAPPAGGPFRAAPGRRRDGRARAGAARPSGAARRPGSASTSGRWPGTSRPAWPTPTCPVEHEALEAAIARPGLGRVERGRQRHLRAAAGRGRRTPRGRGGLRRRHQLLGPAPDGAAGAVRRGRPHLRRLGRRRRALAGGDVVGGPGRGRPRPRDPAPHGAAPHFGLESMAALIEAVHLDRLTEAQCLELTPVLFAVADGRRRHRRRRRTPPGRGGRGTRGRRDAAPRGARRGDRRGARRRRAHRRARAADGRDHPAAARPGAPGRPPLSSGRRRSWAPPCSASTGSAPPRRRAPGSATASAASGPPPSPSGARRRAARAARDEIARRAIPRHPRGAKPSHGPDASPRGARTHRRGQPQPAPRGGPGMDAPRVRPLERRSQLRPPRRGAVVGGAVDPVADRSDRAGGEPPHRGQPAELPPRGRAGVRTGERLGRVGEPVDGRGGPARLLHPRLPARHPRRRPR